MKYFTTFKQAQELVHLGIDQTTADMLYANTKFGWQPTMTDFQGVFIGNERLFPCWSLGALLDVIGHYTMEKYDQKCYIEDDTLYSAEDKDVFHATYELVKQILK